MLEPGRKAPFFDLVDHNGERRSLLDYRGHPLLLLMFENYTSRAATFWLEQIALHLEYLEQTSTRVVAVCANYQSEVALWRHPLKKSMQLLADPTGRTLIAYGALPSNLPLGHWGAAANTSVLVDGLGQVREAWYFVQIAQHAQKVLPALQALQASTH